MMDINLVQLPYETKVIIGVFAMLAIMILISVVGCTVNHIEDKINKKKNKRKKKGPLYF